MAVGFTAEAASTAAAAASIAAAVDSTVVAVDSTAVAADSTAAGATKPLPRNHDWFGFKCGFQGSWMPHSRVCTSPQFYM